MPTKDLEDSWLGFLTELDSQLSTPTTLICMGGFVMTHCYGSPRQTVDLDTCDLAPSTQHKEIERLSCEGSQLYRKYRLYIQRVTVATIPCDHLDRVIQIDTPTLKKLTLCALEAHDLALSKLERSQDRDLNDVQHLAAQGHINAKTLIERYHEEHRLYLLGDLHRYDRTLNLWLNLCWPDQYPD